METFDIHMIKAFNSKCRGFGFTPCDPGPDLCAWKVSHEGKRIFARFEINGWIRVVLFDEENNCSSLPVKGSDFTGSSFRLTDLNSLVNKIMIHGQLDSFAGILAEIGRLTKERAGRGIPVKIY